MRCTKSVLLDFHREELQQKSAPREKQHYIMMRSGTRDHLSQQTAKAFIVFSVNRSLGLLLVESGHVIYRYMKGKVTRGRYSSTGSHVEKFLYYGEMDVEDQLCHI